MLALLSLCSFLCAAASPFQLGRYEGTALNTTANARGKVLFELTANDPAHAEAHFVASEGLSGEAFLTGTIDHGVMRLAGPLLMWTMSVEAKHEGQELVARYSLRGASPQEGEFRVQYAGPLAPPPKRDLASIVGTWEKQDGFAPPLDPITHLPRGDRFEDGGTFTIERDGHFALTHLHNHCDGYGAHCCRLDQVKWNGTLSLEGSALVFEIAGGSQLHHDSCNAAMNGQNQVKPGTFRTSWDLGSHQGTPVICIHLSTDPLCFSKH
jgi:hypothetical protein